MVLIDHVSFRVADLAASRALYEPALAALGWRCTREGDSPDGRYVGFEREDRDDFYLLEPIDEPGRDRVSSGTHLAFAAASRAEVDSFHAAAVANGATDIGAPGVRPQYSGTYYAAFFLDLGGNNVEAVFHSD
ncbi:MAG: glyoxalase/bleomycin resistance/extradiol dioxygenase family protein [Thermoleophilia bacterium]|nr:glyoxalase/bleomycin resistance/extradiol dioxygenase family protein [Thermoleophilia bacterium]